MDTVWIVLLSLAVANLSLRVAKLERERRGE